MATFVGHSLAALTIVAPLHRIPLGRVVPIPWWLALAVLLSLLPDLDLIMLRWLPYSHPLSHRGLSHSVLFALALTLIITLFCRLAGLVYGNLLNLLLVWLGLAAVMASHGLLDALTDGGLGIALFSPLTPRRYFFPVRPLPVAWLSPGGMFSPYMLQVYAVEFALFGPFCLVAWLVSADLSGLSRLPTFRWLAAGALFFVGIGAWIVRSQTV